MVPRIRCSAGALALVLVAALTAAAQGVSTASIGGTVRDAGAGVLPGVTVTATQTDTGLTRTTVSDENGAYLIARRRAVAVD